MRQRVHAISFCLLSLASAHAASPCVAGAQVDSSRTDSLGRPIALPGLTVTAQRREQAAQDVGIALTPLTGRDLVRLGVLQANDLQRVVPALEIEPAFGGGQPQFRLRGVGFSDYASNNSSTVGVYADNIALPFPVQTQGLLFDLARVEVLRGPQGTLYGRNSTGGAVNFVSNRPTAEFSRGLTLEAGSYRTANAEGFVSGSLREGLRGRLAITTQQGGGWQYDRVSTDRFGDRNATAARGQLEWDATSALQLSFIGHGSIDQSDGIGLSLFAPFASGAAGGAVLPADGGRGATGYGIRPAFASIIGKSNGARPGRDNSAGGASLQARLDFGAAQLTSITGYNAFRRRELADWDASASAVSDEAFQDDIGVFSQEVRLASTGSTRFDWLAGAYYSNERLDAKFYSDFTDVPGLGAAALTQYGQRSNAVALFGQSNFRFTPMWALVTGVRLEYEQRELEGLTTAFVGVDPPFVPPTDRRLITREPSAKVALEYRPRRNALAYGSVSRGIKSGGFTAYNTTNVAQLAAFDPEVLNAYEVGTKLEPSPRLRVNASLYHYDYRNQQVLSTVYDPVSKGPIGRIANADRSRIDGGEAEVVWEIARGLELTQYAAVKAGEYTRFVTVDAQASIAQGREVTQDFSDTPLNIPRVSLGGGATYARLAGNQFWRAALNYSYRDRQEASRLIFTPEYDVAPYALLNASVSWSRAGAPWSLELWGRNITDRRYELTRNFFINAQVAAIGPPATFGVRVNYTR